MFRAAIRQDSSSRLARSRAARSCRRACAAAVCRCCWACNACSLAAATATSISCARKASVTGRWASGALPRLPLILDPLGDRRWRAAECSVLRPGVTADN